MAPNYSIQTRRVYLEEKLAHIFSLMETHLFVWVLVKVICKFFTLSRLCDLVSVPQQCKKYIKQQSVFH